MKKNKLDDKERRLSLDIKRSIFLASFIKHWGQPSKRTISAKKGEEHGVEVYEFPPQNDGIYRIVTIGVSSQALVSGHTANWELLLCLPESLGGTDSVTAVNYLLDIMAYSLRPDVEMKIGTLIPESSLAPCSWNTKAILVDEARGEAEEISSFTIGQQFIELLWLIPLTGNEYEFIKSKGIEEFDRIESKSDVSLLDVNRLGIL